MKEARINRNKRKNEAQRLSSLRFFVVGFVLSFLSCGSCFHSLLSLHYNRMGTKHKPKNKDRRKRVRNGLVLILVSGWCALFYLIETNEGSGMRVQLK